MQYDRFRDAAWQLTMEDITKTEAKAGLVKILERDGTFAGKGMEFDHTVLEWTKLREHAFQGKGVKPWRIPLNILEDILPLRPDGFQTALAQTTLYALAAGETQVSVSGERRVIIRKIGRFIHDGFDFNGDQWLGNWECSAEYRGFSSADAAWEAYAMYIEKRDLNLPSRLDNRAFRQFRLHTGYGCDFRSMCMPDVVDIKEISYVAP